MCIFANKSKEERRNEKGERRNEKNGIVILEKYLL